MSATISYHGPYAYRLNHHPAGTVEHRTSAYTNLDIRDGDGNTLALFFDSAEEAGDLVKAALAMRDLLTGTAPAEGSQP